MTYEEAIKILTELKPIPIDGFKIIAEAYDLAIEALEKQTPKKPYWEYGGCHCKSCGLDVLSDEYFCPLCGQAIDWEVSE